MLNVNRSIHDAEKIVGAKFISDADVIGKPLADPNPRNYFVPNFGEDTDITQTKKSGELAEKKLGYFWENNAPADDPPRDYFVPHFGEDHEMLNSADSIKLAEHQLGHFWSPKDAADPPPRNYFVPHFGVDSDIGTSL